MRLHIALYGLLALAAGFVVYRQWSLGRQLDELTKLLGDPAPAAPPREAGKPIAPKAPDTHAERLAALESAIARMRSDIRALEQATGEDPKNLVTDQQILGVLKDHGGKVIESQIKYHRQRWLDQREVGLADFAKRYSLNQEQSDVLWGLLSSEIDQMIEILRDPNSFENPEQAAEAWKKLLLDTDVGAHRVLDPQRVAAWDQVRWLERKILWPWLPE